MRERPILFSAPMVLAILAGKKTQTRRIVKFPRAPNHLGQWEPTTTGGPNGGKILVGGQLVPNPEPEQVAMWHTRTGAHVWCPYGQPGDRLWVKESLRGDGQPGNRREGIARYGADGEMVLPCATCGFVGCTCEGGPSCRMDLIWQWKNKALPSIHCPRWASRLTLDIAEVRVERLQDISEADILAEGVTVPLAAEVTGTPWSDIPDLFTAWRLLWDHINGDRPGASWSESPWVWAISFKRVESAP